MAGKQIEGRESINNIEKEIVTMDFSKFKNTVAYPDRPIKPELRTKKPTPVDYRAHACELEVYATAMEKFDKLRADYGAEEMRVNESAKQAMLADVGLDKHPRREKIYAYAWGEGHGGGFNDVWCVLSDIAHLFKD